MISITTQHPPYNQTTNQPCSHEPDFAVLKSTIVEIKENLKYLSELLTANAHIEERTMTMRREIDTLKTDVNKLKLSEARFSGSTVWIEKVVWAILSLSLGALLMKGSTV